MRSRTRSVPRAGAPARGVPAPTAAVLQEWYAALHARPELSGHERETSRWVGDLLEPWPVTVHRDIGGHGVVAVADRGPGPTVVLRAELDALPVPRPGGDQELIPGPLSGQQHAATSHSCGHDVHMTAVLGAGAALLQPQCAWRGRLVLLFQPAEEDGTGARAMLDDGLPSLVPSADHVLALHTSALATGQVTFRPGAMTSAALTLRVCFLGTGGHAAFPARGVSALEAAAGWVRDVRETAPPPGVQIGIGALRSGHCANVIPESAEVLASVRSATLEQCREQVRSLRHQAHRTAPPGVGVEVSVRGRFTPAVNGRTAGLVHEAFRDAKEEVYLLTEPSPACDDVGLLADGLGAHLAYWFVGANDPRRFDEEDRARVRAGEQPRSVPGNHSPCFMPDQEVLPIAARQLRIAASAVLADVGPAIPGPG